MQTISSIRFSFTRKGELRAELTVAGTDGKLRYPRISNAAAAIKAAKSAGAEVRGYSRVVTLKNAEAIADNGGVTEVTVVEYATTPVRAEISLLGDYAEVNTETVRLAGATSADNAEVAALIKGIAVVPTRRRQADTAETADLG